MINKRVGALAGTVLKVVGIAGILAVGMVAPNVLKGGAFLMGGKRRRDYYPCDITYTITRLRLRGLVTLVRKQHKAYYQLTEKGQKLLAKYTLQEKEIKRQRRWDRLWRIFIFDIQEGRKSDRENVRTALQQLGFLRLQDSVWIYPYPCEDVVELLRTGYGVRKEVFYLEAKRFLGDRTFIDEFGLPTDT